MFPRFKKNKEVTEATEKVKGIVIKGFQIVNIAGDVTNLHPGFRENTVFTEDALKK